MRWWGPPLVLALGWVAAWAAAASVPGLPPWLTFLLALGTAAFLAWLPAYGSALSARQREQGLVAALAALGDVVLVADRRGRPRVLAGEAASVLGPELAAWIEPAAGADRVGTVPEPAAAWAEAWREALAGRAVVRRGRGEGGGGPRELEMGLAPLHGVAGTVQGVVGVLRGRATREEAEPPSVAGAFARAALDAMPGRIAILDGQGVVRLVNRAWREGQGVPGIGELVPGANYVEAWERRLEMGDEQARPVVEGLRAVLDGARCGFALEYGLREGHEAAWWRVQATRFAWDGQEGVLVAHEDVSELRRYQELVAYQALHDAVTGLPNRRLLQDRIEQALARAAARGRAVALVLLDLDEFKEVNDALGHAVGDEVLREVARRLRTQVRAEDTVAACGGDRFAVLLEGLRGPRAAEAVAARLLRALREPLRVGDRPLALTASAGVAYARSGSAEELLRCADIAVHRAKRLGKARYVVYEPAMGAQVMRRAELVGELRRALEADELTVYYQPVVDLRDGTCAGVEALVRWQHPERGLLLPAEFVPVAEETGLIVELGRVVLERACADAAAWLRRLGAAAPRWISVNLSARQFRAPRLVDEVRAALRAAGLAPERLQLEITEYTMMDDAEGTLRVLDALRRLGVRLAIDDFGTGYSSLGYLQRFDADVLKMARSFTQGVEGGAEGRALARAVTWLAEAFELEVIAEGVESPGQWAVLQELGCQYGQGFLFAPPLPGPRLEALLRERPGWLPAR